MKNKYNPIGVILRGMLSYYCQTEEELLEKEMQETLLSVFNMFGQVASQQIPFDDKISKFISVYIDFMIKNPALPDFIYRKITENPEQLTEMIPTDMLNILQLFKDQFQAEVDKGHYIPIPPEQFIINLISVCAFPFLGKALIKIVLKMNDNDFQDFLRIRKTELSVLMINSILIKK